MRFRCFHLRNHECALADILGCVDFFWQKFLFSAALRNQDLFYCLFNKKTYLFNKKEMIKVLGNSKQLYNFRSEEHRADESFKMDPVFVQNSRFIIK